NLLAEGRQSMQPPQSEPPVEGPTPPAEALVPPPDSSRAMGRPPRLGVAALIAALAAGVVGWLGGEATLDSFKPSENASQGYASVELHRQQKISSTRNA